MPTIFVNVKDKIAKSEQTPVVVCGNSDYTLDITFDSEWDAYPVKTMQVVWCVNGIYGYDCTIFEGSTVQLPPIYGAAEIAIGFFAGNIRTTTPAHIPCAQCIKDGNPMIPPPPEDVYEELLEYLDTLERGGANITSDVKALSPGGVLESIIAIAEEET